MSSYNFLLNTSVPVFSREPLPSVWSNNRQKTAAQLCQSTAFEMKQINVHYGQKHNIVTPASEIFCEPLVLKKEHIQ